MVGEGTISALSAWRLIGLGDAARRVLADRAPAGLRRSGRRRNNAREMRRLIGRGLATVATVLFPVAFLDAAARW